MLNCLEYKINHTILPLSHSLGFNSNSNCITSICLFSWIFARKWPDIFHGPQLDIVCGFLSLSAWILVISPVLVLIIWGSWLVVILDRHIIGLAVIMAGTALLLAFYSIMLWWRTQWQSSSMYFLNLFLLIERSTLFFLIRLFTCLVYAKR